MKSNTIKKIALTIVAAGFIMGGSFTSALADDGHSYRDSLDAKEKINLVREENFSR